MAYRGNAHRRGRSHTRAARDGRGSGESNRGRATNAERRKFRPIFPGVNGRNSVGKAGQLFPGYLTHIPVLRESRDRRGPHRSTWPRRIVDFTATDAAFAGFSAHEAALRVPRFTMSLR